jgi:hypothetical protein
MVSRSLSLGRRRTAVWLGKQLTAIGCKVYVQCYRPRLYPSETGTATLQIGYVVTLG